MTETKCCPTCNQPVPPPHGIVFERSEVRNARGTVRLTPRETQFFDILLQNIGRTVSWEAIFARQYGLDPNGGPESTKVLDVRLYNMRSRLNRLGIRITTIWGQGVRLENPNADVPRRNRSFEAATPFGPREIKSA